jgi:hypothetical protein
VMAGAKLVAAFVLGKTATGGAHIRVDDNVFAVSGVYPRTFGKNGNAWLEKKLFDAIAIRRINYIRLDLQIVPDKICGTGIICVNTANPGRCQKHILRHFRFKKIIHCRCGAQIQLCRTSNYQVGKAFCFKFTHDSRADQSIVPSHKYF